MVEANIEVPVLEDLEEMNDETVDNTVNIAKVIVVAGFLGSGKTTLIESLLKAPELSKRVAVI